MFIEIKSCRIHYEICGSSGPNVLLLHGWGCNIGLMQPLAQKLKDSFHLLMIDLPGHGESDEPPEPWGVPEYAECIKNLIDSVHFIPCYVIAHSFGCRIAALIASEPDNPFQKMILTGAAGIRKQATEKDKKRSRSYQKKKKWIGYLKKTRILGALPEKLEKKLREKYGSKDYNALNEEMRKTFVKIIQQDLSGYYPQIKNSTLLIWGEMDTETPIWMGERMKELIPDSGLVRFEGCSHFAYLEQPERFVLIAKHFFSEA